LTVPLTKASIRLIARGSVNVLTDLAEARDINDAEFVEHRRQLQQALMDSGNALRFAGPRARRRARPYREFEQQCVRVGFWVLGEAWRPTRANAARCATMRSHRRQVVPLVSTDTTAEDLRRASERLGG